MLSKDKIVREVTAVACKLHKERGIPHRQACLMAARAVLRVLGEPPGGGMGEATSVLAKAAELELVKKVRGAVSPWLWVLSIGSFGMAVLNTKRIARMFKGWKGKARTS